MTKILLLPAALALVVLAGCASGGATQPTYTATTAPSGFGEVRVIYKDAAAANHPTEWNLDGGSWRPVGGPAVEVGAYTHQVDFRALKSGDNDPPAIPVVVREDKRAVVKVYYQ